MTDASNIAYNNTELPKNLFSHQDVLAKISQNIPLMEKLSFIHDAIRQRYEFVSRIAIALYDEKTDQLKTYAHSSDGEQPLSHYQTTMADAASLQQIKSENQPRVVNDLEIFSQGESTHTKKIAKQGYRASYTLPVWYHGVFFGFIFINSHRSNVFEESVLEDMDLYAHIVSLLVINEQLNVRTLLGSVKAAHDMTYFRDNETGGHIDRMARYARLIAVHLADDYDLNDEYIENIFLFAPLHDLGKIAIPDAVLKKPGALSPDERVVMRTHARRGREIIDQMLSDFGLQVFEHVDILRNIAEFHHEAINGSGYPEGLKGDAIPLEARIVAVADVFDALTSERPYKSAWSIDEAVAALLRLAGTSLDKDCVQALVANRPLVEEIQARFTDR